jgi:uncharacterized membrane protein YagU involved in acid resistance
MVRNSGFRAVLVGGSIAGALDILFALTFAAVNGTMPVLLLQTVASGVLGDPAYAGGTTVAFLGLCLHFALSYLWALSFVAVASRNTQLLKIPVLTGALFGIAVFFVMNLVVLPLSAFPHIVTFKQPAVTFDLISHMFLFGVPIAIAAAAAIRRKDLA